jgi:hypothetical protein
VGDIQFSAENCVVMVGVEAFKVSHVMLLLFGELRETAAR